MTRRAIRPTSMRTGSARLLAFPVAAGLLLGSVRALAADGAALYQARCAGCHGADGKADSPTANAMKVPALAGTKLAPEEVARHVRSSDRHTSLAAKLSDEELLAIAKALPGR